MMNNATILVTGGTGSFGKRFVSTTLENYNPKKIIIFSRDEMKQWEMQRQLGNDDRVGFFVVTSGIEIGCIERWPTLTL